MPDYELTPSEIISLQAQMRRDMTELAALTEAQMIAEAKAAVLDSESYLTAAEIEAITGISQSGHDPQLYLWERDKKVFSFNHCGIDYFPAYALNPQGGWKPYIEIAKIIQIFDGTKSGWGCAFWFEAVNGYLGGAAPKNILAVDPARVIKAALLEIEPIAHS
jgi:hypothetical protein